MKLVTANGKKQIVISKLEWTSIGKAKGWLPRKRLFAAETKTAAIDEAVQRKQLAAAQKVAQAIRDIQSVQAENPFINSMFLNEIDSVRHLCDSVAESIQTDLGELSIGGNDDAKL